MRKLYAFFVLIFVATTAQSQTTICTNHNNSNGAGSIIFNVQNSNSYGIVIQEIDAIMFGGTAGSYTFQLLQNTTPVTNQNGTWTLGTVGAGQNGWVQVGSSSLTLAAQTTPVPVLTGLNIVIPAGATYSFGLSTSGTIGYQTLTAGAGVNNFTAGGVSLQTGDGISWGGGAYPSTPVNYPRGWDGCIVFIPSVPCTVPTAQPTALSLTSASTTQINGSFTAAAGSPTNYLVVRYPHNAAVTNPVNGTNYTVGSSLGLGTIVSNNSSTTFSATGLSPSTIYDFYIYSANSGSCFPNQYLTTSPLSAFQTTLACSPLAAGTYTVGPTGTYPTLTAAVGAISGGWSGNVILELQNTYTSAGETFPITFNAPPCPFSGNVTIRPQAGAVGLSINSSNATATIDLNGAKNILLDGRPGGIGTTSQLSIINTSSSGVAVRVINDAQNNTITYCDVQGQNTTSPATATPALAGVIYISTAGTLNQGNDNNTISNCNIHGTGAATLPAVGIFAIGSTTTAAAYNDNCTIANCNIYDFFSGTLASAGIKIDAGNSSWTISGNSFYQAAARTYTVANTHRAIWLTPNITNLSPQASGFTVTANLIGGSAPVFGGAPYTMLGGVANVFLPMDISVGLGAATSIQNNSIANIAFTTTSTGNPNFAGINIANGNVNVGNVTGNTIGSGSGTGSITINQTTSSGGTVYGIRLGGGTGTTVAMNNNIIGSFTINGSAATISDNFIGIGAVGGSNTLVAINGNTIGSSSTANSINQTSNGVVSVALTGITVTSGATGNPLSVSNNLVANLTSSCTSTGLTKGINVSVGIVTMTGNTVRSLSTQSTATTTGASSAIVGISITATSVGHTISNNIIHSLSLTSAGTGAYQLTGMFYGGPTTGTTASNTITRNFIHSLDLTTATNTSATLTGIDISSGFGTFTNNMIRLGIRPDGSDLTNAIAIRGISINSSNAVNIYFNSVYIGGVGVGTIANNTFAYNRTITSAAGHDVRDNIFVNNRSNATTGGIHYAAKLAAATTIFPTLNFNNYQYSGSGGKFANNGTTDFANYTPGWIAGDNNSVVGDPQFVNPTGNASVVDLHINVAVPTPVESSGIAIATVTDDFDGQARAGLTPTDIGADAGNFLALDVQAPVISYSSFSFSLSCGTGDRTLTGIVITDVTGVPTSGSLRPRIYYKKGVAGTYFSQPGTLTSGTATNGTWSFPIIAADMGGVANGDVIFYYIVAQDVVATPNIGSNPAGAIATDVNSVTTHPTSPNSYTVNSTSLAGTYTVGAAGVYTTLTAAVNAYNNACLAGPVTFLLTDALYSAAETFPININANPYASVTNTLTIKPATGVSPTISGISTSTTILRWVGADYVTVDGSNVAGGTTRDLTIKNINATTSGTTVLWVGSQGAGAGAINNTIKNCTIQAGTMGSATLVTFGIFVGDVSGAANGADNDNLTIQNNAISNTWYGIQVIGGTTSSDLDNLTITNNTFGSATAANSIGLYGVLTGQGANVNISNNTMTNIGTTATALTSAIATTGNINTMNVSNNTINGVGSNTSTGQAAGIFISTNIFGTTISGNTISNIISNASVSGTASNTAIFVGTNVINTTVSQNKITSIYNVSTGGWGSRAIIASTGSNGSNLAISNNMVTDVTSYSDASNSFWPIGIDIDGATGGVRIYHNTVNLYGAHPGLTSATGSAAIFLNTTGLNIDLRDNIFTNSYDNTSSAADKNYALYTAATTGAQFSNINYNDYYVSGPATVLAFINSTDQTSLAAIQSTFGGNANSLTATPFFVSNTDLHMDVNTNIALDNKGTPIATVTTDIDGQTRSLATPDMGADEFTSIACVNAIGGTVSGPASICVNGTGSATLTGTGYSVGPVSSYQWQLSPDNVNWTDLSGQTNPLSANTGNIGVSTYFRLKVGCANDVSGYTAFSNSILVVVNQRPSVTNQPSNLSLCPGNVAIFTVGALGTGITYQWRKNGVNLNNGGNISGATSNTLTISGITAADASTCYDVVVSGVCTPAATSSCAILAVGAAPLITQQPISQIACQGNTVVFTVASSSSGLTYQWFKGATPLVNGGNISGATSATLVISNITATDAGNYTVVITNSCGQSTTSSVAVLTFSLADRWLGTANSDWNNPTNWCNGVPTLTTDVVIPAGTPFPAIVAATSELRNLQIDAGATMTVGASGWLNIYGTTLTLNGTFNTSAGTIAFRNTANLNVPAMTVNNVVMNGTGGITLTGNMNITTALTLTAGNITIGNNNVNMTGGTIGSVSSHIITNGTGVVTNTNISIATVVFPVGAAAATYNPLQIAAGQGLNYSVRVSASLPAVVVNPAIAINRTWVITSSATPAAPVQLTFNYADAHGNASYNPANRMEVGYLSGTNWTILTGNGGILATGNAAARQVYVTTNNFGTAMVVSNVGGLTGIVTAAANVDADLYSVKLMPNVVNNQSLLRVMSRRAMNVEWMVTDIQGRVVMKFNRPVLAGQNDFNLQLGRLATGSYQIVGYSDKGVTNVVKFVRL